MNVHAIIFDWAGTTVDHGSRAPVAAMRKVFADRGVMIHDDDLRADMGLAKRDHLAAIVERHDIGLDVDDLHRDLERTLLDILPDYATPLPGVVDAVTGLREHGYCIGSTTGYGVAALALLTPLAAERGYAPDVSVCPGALMRGRPAPDMLWYAATMLGAPSAAACVAVGDTAADMQAARNAGMWAVGVTHTSSLVGLSTEGLAALLRGDQIQRIVHAGDTLIAAGAHYLVNSAADIGKAVRAIEHHGSRP